MTEIIDVTGKIAAALAKAQSVISNPEKNREVTVKGVTKTGKEFNYTFKYTTLDRIIETVRKPLTDNGLWFTQTLENADGGRYNLVTALWHESGQSIRSETPLLVDGATNQAFGSALTYMRRYALAAMPGIASDEDDDANQADGNQSDGHDLRGKRDKKSDSGDSGNKPMTKTTDNRTITLVWADGLKRKFDSLGAYLDAFAIAVRNNHAVWDVPENKETLRKLLAAKPDLQGEIEKLEALTLREPGQEG